MKGIKKNMRKILYAISKDGKQLPINRKISKATFEGLVYDKKDSCKAILTNILMQELIDPENVDKLVLSFNKDIFTINL